MKVRLIATMAAMLLSVNVSFAREPQQRAPQQRSAPQPAQRRESAPRQAAAAPQQNRQQQQPPRQQAQQKAAAAKPQPVRSEATASPRQARQQPAAVQPQREYRSAPRQVETQSRSTNVSVHLGASLSINESRNYGYQPSYYPQRSQLPAIHDPATGRITAYQYPLVYRTEQTNYGNQSCYNDWSYSYSSVRYSYSPAPCYSGYGGGYSYYPSYVPPAIHDPATGCITSYQPVLIYGSYCDW